jgi:RNA polymerase sporulation-specific sigma factor
LGGNKLVEDNIGLVHFIIRRYYPTFASNEDVIQEGTLGLVKAANTFDESRGAKFSTYATMCIINQIRVWCRNNLKHNNVLSYDVTIVDDVGEEISFLDLTIGDEDIDIDTINFKRFYNTLSDSEKELVQMLIKYNQNEIGEKYGLAHNTISYRKRRLSRKWREFNSDRK